MQVQLNKVKCFFIKSLCILTHLLQTREYNGNKSWEKNYLHNQNKNPLIKKNKNKNIHGAVYRKSNLLQNNFSGRKTTKISNFS